MRVLVNGDRGYVGAVLVPALLQAGHDVEGLDAGWYDGCDFGEQPHGYTSRTGDIRDVTPEDLQGFDAVVHLAAISNDPVGHLNPEATYSVNAEGAAHVARAAKAAGVGRFLFSSSCSLYGAAGAGAVAEDSPVTFAEGASPDERDYRVDFTKITRQLPAFRPEWTVLDGIKELAVDMDRIGLTTEDFEGERYVRLHRVNRLRAEGRLNDLLRSGA